MRKLFAVALLLLSACASQVAAPPPLYADAADGLQAKVTEPSRFVPARTVQVWLPPGYATSHRRYPAIYLHDGQNVYDEPAKFSGTSWFVHRALERGIADGSLRPAILVAIWNTDNRLGEYMPEAGFDAASDAMRSKLRDELHLSRADIVGDAYLRFLLEELKPRIDARYRTRTGARDTMLMGSSMGGLISAYALSRYPHTFGAAACLSTSWPIGDGFASRWYADNLPDAATHRLYFDYGTGTEDGTIAPYQADLTAAAHTAGYVDGRDWLVREWPGDKHTESAWAGRVQVPLSFLLGRGVRR